MLYYLLFLLLTILSLPLVGLFNMIFWFELNLKINSLLNTYDIITETFCKLFNTNTCVSTSQYIQFLWLIYTTIFVFYHTININKNLANVSGPFKLLQLIFIIYSIYYLDEQTYEFLKEKFTGTLSSYF